MANTERIDRRIQELEERLEQQRALLDRLKARKVQTERKLDTRRKIVIGAVVLRKAKTDPEFRTLLLGWLNEGLTTPRDRELFGLDAVASNQENLSGFSTPANDDCNTKRVESK